MKLITKRDRIQGVLRSWIRQYRTSLDEHRQSITENLKCVDYQTATEHDIADIIGNYTWTELICEECKNDVGLVVSFGKDIDYESNSVNVCQSCLKKAIKFTESCT